MSTYARSLNNLDLTDKSGIVNLILNPDLKINQRRETGFPRTSFDQTVSDELGYPSSKKRKGAFIADTVWFEWNYDSTVEFNLNIQRFNSIDWPVSDSIPSMDINAANRIKINYTKTGACNPKLKFACFDIGRKVLGQVLTFSFWYKSLADNIAVTPVLYLGTTNNIETCTPNSVYVSSKNTQLSEDWAKFTYTFTLPNEAILKYSHQQNSSLQDIQFGKDGNELVFITIVPPPVIGTYYIAAPQLEVGNIATQYSSALYELSELAAYKYMQAMDVYLTKGTNWINTIIPLNNKFNTFNDEDTIYRSFTTAQVNWIDEGGV